MLVVWFRWHHGTVNDPKFRLVAAKAGATVAEVIAVWASLLEAASAAADRGNFGEIDVEALECSLGLSEGQGAAILGQMHVRGLISRETGRVSAWDKRQPKRERDDDSSTDRVRAFRDRQRQQQQGNGDETPGNANTGAETPRREEKREEEKEPSSPPAAPASDTPRRSKPKGSGKEPAPTSAVWDSYAAAYERRYGVQPVRNASVNGQLSQFVSRVPIEEAPAIAAFYVGHENQLYRNAQHPVNLLLRDAESLRTQWVTGRSVLQVARPSPAATESAYQRGARERMAAFAPGVAARAPTPQPETIDVDAVRLD